MITKATTELLLERSGGICEICARRPGSNRHHRRPRGLGGSSRPDTDLISNLIMVCGSGSVSGCHGYLETHRTESLISGLLVRQAVDDVAAVPVHLACGWVLLAPDGTYTTSVAA